MKQFLAILLLVLASVQIGMMSNKVAAPQYVELPEEICQAVAGDTLTYTINKGVMNLEFKRFSNQPHYVIVRQ